MPTVFISYSHKDSQFTKKLAQAFKDNEVSFWMDEGIDTGDRWFPRIIQEIRACRFFVVIMTPDAEASEWVQKEILIALRHGKKILPLLLRGHEFDLLIDQQFEDVRGDKLPSKSFFEQLSGDIGHPKEAPPADKAGLLDIQMSPQQVSASSAPEAASRDTRLDGTWDEIPDPNSIVKPARLITSNPALTFFPDNSFVLTENDFTQLEIQTGITHRTPFRIYPQASTAYLEYETDLMTSNEYILAQENKIQMGMIYKFVAEDTLHTEHYFDIKPIFFGDNARMWKRRQQTLGIQLDPLNL